MQALRWRLRAAWRFLQRGMPSPSGRTAEEGKKHCNTARHLVVIDFTNLSLCSLFLLFGFCRKRFWER